MIPSSEAHRHLPGRLTLCSLGVGWRSALLRRYVEPTEVAEVTTPPTTDHLIVLIRKAGCDIESFRRGRWQRARYRAGDLGMTPPGEASRLRWQGASGKETLQLHIPADAMRNVAAEMRSQTAGRLALPNQLRCHDPVIAAVMMSLERALAERSPDIYAEAALQFLAAHLLTRHAGAKPRTTRHENPSRLALVEECMRARLSEPLSLKDLSTVVDLSVFQLIRMCRARWGETPLARLTRLRMERAQEMLQHGDESIIEIALECGYGNPAHFATAFKRRVGASPSRFRADRQFG